MSFNPLLLADRRYLITGAASGMGRATAIYLSKLEADLILVDINAEQLEITKSQCKSTDSVICVDLTNIELLKQMLFDDTEINGKINGFVHCAGLPYIAPLKMVMEEKAMRIYKLNAYVGMELAKFFINRKIYAGCYGSIVYISSVYGIVGSAANVGYAMTKGAIQSMTRALAIELTSKQIRVNCIAPGFVKTEMANSVNHNFDENYEKQIEQLHPLG